MRHYSFGWGGEVTNSDEVHCGFLTLCKKGEKSQHTSAISQSPEQADMTTASHDDEGSLDTDHGRACVCVCEG